MTEVALFFAFGAVALVSALGVVFTRNTVHAALSLVVTLLSMAVFFLIEDAALVAIIQVVVYASAVVVLFLFVIFLLGVDKHEPRPQARRYQRPAALVLGVLLLAELVALTRNHWVTGAHSTRGALASQATGNVQTLAETLFTDFFWAFEVTAALLVIAVVGGVVLARRSRQRAATEQELGELRGSES